VTVRSIQLMAPQGMPSVQPGTDLAKLILTALSSEAVTLQDHDLVVLAQKIVSKAEDRYVDLEAVTVSAEALRLAVICQKDPRLVEMILAESVAVVRCQPGIIIVRHRLGFVLANAGIDQSNLPNGGNRVLLLPKHPDATASALKDALENATGVRLGVAIIDSIGRAWRLGTVGTCIGAAGFRTIHDLRGTNDLFGRKLVSTVVGSGDEVAAAASMLMGQASEATPLVVMRGLLLDGKGAENALDLIRPAKEDMFP
jgi:coenzyme F420-0:L-glutamate ligase/coenzyme F420-1:gamma-L-glutamate ligase